MSVDLAMGGVTAIGIVAVKATIVLVFSWLLAYGFRHRSAALRHMVWTLGIAGALTLPLATVAIPFELGVLPAVSERVQTRSASAPETEGATNETGSATSLVESSVPRAAEPSREIPAGTIAIVVWSVIAGLLLVRFAVGTATVAWLSRTSPEITDREWNIALARHAERTGVHRPVRLLRTSWTEMPLTWGIVEPVILVPSDALNWDAERRDVVLLHELAHIHRNDTITLGLGQLVNALYWFNPVVWIATRRLRAEAERACDDWVLAAGMRASAYADHLLAMVRTVGRARLPAAVAMPMAQRSGFEGRLLAILEPGAKRGRTQKAQVLMISTTVASLVLVLAALVPVRTQATPGNGSPDPEIAVPSNASGYEDDGDIDVEAGDNDLDSYVDVIAEAEMQESPAVVGALTEALADADAEVRLLAARSLAEMQDPRAIAALIEALKTDRDAEVRRTSAWALGNIGSSTAVQALSEAVRSDANMEVRTTAAWALGNIGHSSGVDALAANVKASHAPLREQAVWALGNIGSSQGVTALATVLDDADANVREQAVWALGNIGSGNAVAPLIASLRREAEPTVKEQIVWALGNIGDDAAVDALSSVLRDASPRVRRQGAWALGQIEPRTAPEALRAAITDADAGVRRQVVWALGQIEDAGSAPALRTALKDADAGVRRAALRALAGMDDPAAQEALIEMLKSDDPEIKKEAARMLGGGGFHYIDPQPQPRPRPRPRPGGGEP